MFETIRAHQKILQAVLLVLILPAFVFFGISGYEGMFADDRALARVGRETITQATFAAAQQQQIASLRSMLGEEIDASMLDTPKARAELLETLIAQRALTREAQLRHVQLTDERVRQIILNLPGIKGEDGSFDEARYVALLGAQGLTPARFEAQLRVDAAAELLADVAQHSVWLPRTVRDRLIATQEEERWVRWLRFGPTDYVAQVRPTQAMLEQFYATHAADFERPESARVEYVVLSREALAAQARVSEDEIKAYYLEHATQFEQPEQRRARHILLKSGDSSLEQAKVLVAQLRSSPEEFANLAKTRSVDPGSAAQGGDLGFFARDMMVKPFADAVFKMREGEISEPIETEFGVHVIQLIAIKPVEKRPLATVQAEIEQTLRSQKAAQQYAQAEESFTNMVYEQADSLQPVVQSWSLPVQTADHVARAPAQPGAALPPALAHPRVLAALFADDVLHKKRNTEAIEFSPGQMVAARVVAYQPARRLPLAEVIEQVRQRVVQEEARERAKQAGQARLEELRKGAALDSMPTEGQLLSRVRSAPLSAAETAAVFKVTLSAQDAPVWVGVEQESGGFSILQVNRAKPLAPELIAQKRATYEPQYGRAYAQQTWRDYVEALKARSAVERHPERLVAR